MSKLFLNLILILIATNQAQAQTSVQLAQRAAENQVRHMVEPVIERYCHDACKLLSINTTVDVAIAEEVAPGFDDIDPKSAAELQASSATIKLLIDDQMGPVSRRKLLDLMQQYMDTLDFPVKIEAQTAHFPLPSNEASKVADMRERITKRFKQTLDDLFAQFCPNQCLLADLNLRTESVNPEEAQYGQNGEYLIDGTTALKINELSAMILVDHSLTPEEQQNIVEMARLKTNYFKNVGLNSKALKFPRPPGYTGPGSDDKNEETGANGRSKLRSTQEKSDRDSKQLSTSQTTAQDNATRQEKLEHYEKIERVENGDAVQKELGKFKTAGLVFGVLILLAMAGLFFATLRPQSIRHLFSRDSDNTAQQDQSGAAQVPAGLSDSGDTDRNKKLGIRYEIERLKDELLEIYCQQPKVAKQVFSRILTEEGVEVTACYIHLFGESIVIDMLRDPSLQTDVNELMEFYAKSPIELKDEDTLDLLKKLHSRTVAGKLVIMGSRSSHQFDFLSEMDGQQILELIRNESMTVKSIVMTQCDPQKRAAIYAQIDDGSRMKLLSELSRIDYLPKDYITNVANALKRKRQENPRLNTEALPGSEVLVTLLERTGREMQHTVVRDLERQNPDSARVIKNKLVSLNTLQFLRDGQLLEVVLSLKHEELLQFLKATSDEIRNTVFSRAPKELSSELDEEVQAINPVSREAYQNLERKIINRIKVMANDGLINLNETNERMFAEQAKVANVNSIRMEGTQTIVKRVAS